MKARLISGILVLTGIALLSSCGKDPEPSAGISFEVESEEINESNGTLASLHPEIQSGGVGQEIKVKLILDKPLAENAVVTYSVTGTANKKNVTTSTTNGSYTTYSDFYLDGNNAKETETLVLEKGATEAEITLSIFEDYDFEVDDTDDSGNYVETIIFTLESVVSGPVSLAETNLVNTLSIIEDDAVIFLNWETLDSNVADLDLIVTTNGKVANYSDNLSNDGTAATGGEALFLPGGFPAGTYNLSFPYYSGTSDNVKFTVYMFSNSGTLNGKSYPFSGSSALSFVSPANYKLPNINPYTDYTATVTLQTMVKSGINYTNISAISAPPATGSRTSGVSGGSRPSLKPLKLRNDQVKKILNNLKH